MFKKITLDNFMSFDHLEFDLSDGGKGSAAMPYAVIYGENGSGKSNLVSSFMFLKDTLYTLSAQSGMDRLKTFAEELNLDGSEGVLDLSRIEPMTRLSMREIIKGREMGSGTRSYRMMGGGPMRVSYDFTVDGRDGSYTLSFGEDDRVVREEMTYRVNARTVTLFSVRIDGGEPVFNGPIAITDRGYLKEILERIDRYWGRNTFLSVLIDEMDRNNREFMLKKTCPALMKIIDFFNAFAVSFRGETEDARYQPFKIRNLSKGLIRMSDKEHLLKLERALSSFFRRTYSDIEMVRYHIETRGSKLSYRLFFSKVICGEVREIEAICESSGTLKLLDNFQALLSCCHGNTVIIDELDSGIHDLMVDNMFMELIDANKGQIIITTHNTVLLEHISPRRAFVIQVDSERSKSIARISDIARTQKNHNNRDRYMCGLFGGIPTLTGIYFEEICESLAEEGRSSA